MGADKVSRRKRIDCKIMQLPSDIRQQVEDMIAGREKNYLGISDWLDEQGYQISKSAIGEYALCMGKVAQRLSDDLAKSKAILEYTKNNPELDPAKAAQIILSSNLLQKIVSSENELQEMPIENAGKLLAALRRVDVADRKLAFDMRSKADLALEGLETALAEYMSDSPALANEFNGIMQKVRKHILDAEL